MCVTHANMHYGILMLTRYYNLSLSCTYQVIAAIPQLCKTAKTYKKRIRNVYNACNNNNSNNNNNRHLGTHKIKDKRSTGTQLLECFQDWFLEIHNKKAIDIVYIDYSRAFDSLVHSKLLIKLSSYGISHELFGWIKCFLEGRTQSVSIDGHVSTPLDVVSGVVQGSNLGPLLFILFIMI